MNRRKINRTLTKEGLKGKVLFMNESTSVANKCVEKNENNSRGTFRFLNNELY